jgi:hypothetical protein
MLIEPALLIFILALVSVGACAVAHAVIINAAVESIRNEEIFMRSGGTSILCT